jgi:hypothetical protein
MYLSLKKLAQKYDIHPDTIKKKSGLKEGVHYVNIGKMKRYHIVNMHKLLTLNETTPTVENILSKLLIEK